MSGLLEHGFAPLALLGIEWVRPWGLLALLAPLLLLLFLRRPRPPRSEATGTLELWRRVEGEELHSSARTRHGVSWRAWVLCLALGLAALAIAGPRREHTPERERWRVIVDRSPSMYLPLRVGDSKTRYQAALAAALEILGEVAGEQAEVRWITPGEESVESGEPPASWGRVPLPSRAEPRWERWDAPGTLWLTDRAVPRPREGAGLAASGGEAIPGPVGVSGGRWIEWDGEELRESGSAPPARVEVAEELPEALRRLATIWAEERGYALSGGGWEPALRLSSGGSEERAQVRGGRDGWALTGVAARSGVVVDDGWPPLETWLRGSGGGATLVAHRPGQIVIAWREITSITGDPASFAAAWAALFDAAALPPAGVLSLAEREGVGGARRIEPSPAPARGLAGGEEVAVEAWLALAAAILAALAWSIRGGGAGLPGRQRSARDGEI